MSLFCDWLGHKPEVGRWICAHHEWTQLTTCKRCKTIIAVEVTTSPNGPNDKSTDGVLV